MGPSEEKQDVLSAKGLWGDQQFCDATIVLGDTSWKVHRWVICRQSDYFMAALEGEFKEAQNKTIVLVVGQDFEAADVDGMLKYLYTGVLQPRQKQDSLKAFVVAEYFKVKSLRSAALDALRHQIGEFIGISYWRNYHKLAVRILFDYPESDPEKVLVQVTAKNAEHIIHQPGVLWDEIVRAHPSFANNVLKEIFRKQQPATPQLLEKTVTPARRAAFDDTRRPQTSSPRAPSRFPSC